jgi:hypothetical protein
VVSCVGGHYLTLWEGRSIVVCLIEMYVCHVVSLGLGVDLAIGLFPGLYQGLGLGHGLDCRAWSFVPLDVSWAF